MKPCVKTLLIIILIISPIISYSQKTTHYFSIPTVTLTEHSSGKKITVSNGRSITLTLSDKVDGGYRFDSVKYDTTVLRLEKHTQRPPDDKSRIGSPGHDRWQFTAIKKGKTTLKITASRPWARGATITIFSNTIVVK
jgi:predicted secreted protein